MKKITIEIDDAYSDCICFTFIGHGDGFRTNVHMASVNLALCNTEWEGKLVRKNNDVTSVELVEA